MYLQHTCCMCEKYIDTPPSGDANICDDCTKREIAETVRNKYILDKYGRNRFPRITEDMYKQSWLIDKGFTNHSHRPIKCFTCGEKNILEIEVFSQKAVSCKDIEDFSDLFDKEKRKNIFTGEMEFSIEYRCLECNELAAIKLNDKIQQVW